MGKTRKKLIALVSTLFLGLNTSAIAPGETTLFSLQTYNFSAQDHQLRKKVEQKNQGLIKQNDKGKVDLKVVVDEEFIKSDENWFDSLVQTIDEVNKIYEREFYEEKKPPIVFEIDEVAFFKTENDINDLSYHLSELGLVDLDGNDVVIGFTGQDIDKIYSGLAYRLSNPYTIVWQKSTYFLKTVAHELAHLFGAVDYDKNHPLYFLPSAMSYYYPHSYFETNGIYFDEGNKSRVKENRDRVWFLESEFDFRFGDYLKNFDQTTRSQIIKLAIYRDSNLKPSQEVVNSAIKLKGRFPDDIYLQLVYASILKNSNQCSEDVNEEFVNIFNKIVATKPEDAGFFYYRAANELAYRWALAEKNLDLATILAAITFESQPDNCNFSMILGVVNLKNGDLEKAIFNLENASYSCSPTYISDRIRSLQWLIQATEKKGDFLKFCKANESLIELESFEGIYYNNFAYALADTFDKDYDKALELVAKADQLYPKTGFIYDTIGWIYYKKGDLGKAFGYLEKAIELELKSKTRRGILPSKTNGFIKSSIYASFEQLEHLAEVYSQVYNYRNLNPIFTKSDYIHILRKVAKKYQEDEERLEDVKKYLELANRLEKTGPRVVNIY